MQDSKIEFIKKILTETSETRDLQFTGAGLIFYKDFNGLPVNGLRQTVPDWLTLPYSEKQSLASIIKKLNSAESMFHDGFHLLSKDGAMTHVSQYFSPPIDNRIKVDYTKGGRFRAAQYGSCIKKILAVGVIGQTYGPYIFINGITYKL